MKVFEYCILLQPTEKEAEEGKAASLIVPITPVLAKDQSQATMLAGRSIPDENLEQLDRIEVAVRPF